VATDIIHPRLLAALGNKVYPQTCDIQVFAESQNSIGQVIKDWSTKTDEDETDYSAIRCRFAPASGQEVKGNAESYAVATHRIALRGHYPLIIETERAVIAGQAYDIQAVEHDGQRQTTYLDVKKVA
jgi:head-tail adaptor